MTIHLNVFPTYDEVRQFLNDIIPRLEDCGLNLKYEVDNAAKEVSTAPDGSCAKGTFEVSDDEGCLFTTQGHTTFNYTHMQELSRVLECKHVELQLNALLPRMAAVGWSLNPIMSDGDDYSPYQEDARADRFTTWRFMLSNPSGTGWEFIPSYVALNRLRQELVRAEATNWVQEHWLKLEKAGCEVTFDIDVIRANQNGDKRIYGYTLEEAKDLVETALCMPRGGRRKKMR